MTPSPPRGGWLWPGNRARPGVSGAVQTLFTDFFEQRGDRLCADDPAVLTGVGLFHGRPVTVLGTRKGADLEENLACHFGMPTPEGYRKALRAMEQAEKFGRPILTFVDTPGAYPGLEAEARGQGAAIAACLARMSTLSVPLIAVILGEGGSGGALALAMGNRVLMAENAVYSVLSPEGFASILWKDSSRAGEACGLMKLTSADLLELQVLTGSARTGRGRAHRPGGVLAHRGRGAPGRTAPGGKAGRPGPPPAAPVPGHGQRLAQRRKGNDMNGLQVLGTGAACLPGRRVTNEDFARTLDTSDEWIAGRTGIRQRYFCAEGETAASLATVAARRALDDADISPADVGVCIAATFTADRRTPALACEVQAALGLPETALCP